MHAKNPVPLENEPKYLAVGKLKGFRISASHARDSILGHNSILWGGGDGFAKPGEEVTDLGIQDENDLQPSGLTGQECKWIPLLRIAVAIKADRTSLPT